MRTLDSRGVKRIDAVDDIAKKITSHKKRKRLTISLLVILLSIICAASGIIYYYHTYEGYVVTSVKEHSTATYVRYDVINGLQLRYTKDGASLFKKNNELIWSITYEMQSPIVNKCGSYLIIYEKNGTLLYLFDENKAVYTYQSTMPIKKACVNQKGYFAMLLEENEKTGRFLYLNSIGESIAEGRTFYPEKGYPLNMSLSSDGYKLCISYYILDEALPKTNMVFYSFDEIGDANIDNVVTNDTYEDTVIPGLCFMDDSSLAAIGNKSILIYSKEKKPELIKTIKQESEIASVFYDENEFGIVSREDSPSVKSKITVYKSNGKKKSSFETDFEINSVSMDYGRILLYNSKGWEIYLSTGQLKAKGRYSSAIEQMEPLGRNEYIIVSNNKIEVIRLSDRTE